MRTSRLGLAGGEARANGEAVALHDCMKRAYDSAERRAPSLGARSLRALRRAAAALPAVSRRFRSRHRVRCSEPSLSGSRRPSRGGAASRSSFRASAGLRAGAARALAGAFVLLALGVLAAPQAEAQTPALTGLTASPVAGSTDKLDVSWTAWTPKPDLYNVQWKAPGQSYDNNRRKQVGATPLTNPTGTQITGLTADTEYDVRVTAVDSNLSPIIRAQSETTATTNATAGRVQPRLHIGDT